MKKKKLLRYIVGGVMILLVTFGSLVYAFFKSRSVFADSTLAFDEGYGATVNDKNSNITGTITNAVWKTDDLCKKEKCLYFDGTGDLINFGDDADLDHVGSDNFTLEGWFRTPDITSGQRTIIAKYDGSTGTDGGYKVYMDSSGYLIFGIDNDQTGFPSDSVSTSTTAFDDNKWHFFSAVKSGASSITIYVDSVEYATDSTITSSTLANTDTFYVGMDGDGTSNGFIGFIDEIKVYNSARTATEIKSDFLGTTVSRGTTASFAPNKSFISNGLVGYWKMDEATNTSRSDLSGNGNTLTETTGDDIDGVGGQFGNAGDFENSTSEAEYLLITDAGQMGLDITGNITLCAWIKPESLPGSSIVGKFNSPNLAYNLQLTTNGRIQFYLSPDGTDYSNSSSSLVSAISTGVWSHVCGTYDGNLMRVFVNGQQNGTSTSYSSGTYNGSAEFRIGGAWGDYFDGIIDETRVYNRTLTPSEISELYNFAPGPVGWWKMDENTGTDVNDSSGNGFVGSWSGSSHWVAGMFGSSGKFNGIDDIVTIGDISSKLNLQSADPPSFTASAWIKPATGTPDNGGLKFHGTGNVRFIYDSTCPTNACFKFQLIGGGTTSTSTIVPSLETWYYLTETYSQSDHTMKLYVNGILQDTDVLSSYDLSASAMNVTLGYNQFYFKGGIDDVKIYNYVRTSEQMIEDMNAGHPAPGSPVGSALVNYKFDDGYGNTAYNVGNGESALNGSITSGTWSNAGKFNKALTFTASTSVTTTITDPAYTNAISLWVYPTTSIASKTLVTATKLITDSSSRPTYGSCVGSVLSLSTWTHIVAISNSSGSCEIYQNGLLTSSGTTGVTFGTSINIGATSYIGSIDEFKFFNIPITADQVKVLYNQSSSTVMGAISTDSTGNASNASVDSYCPPGQGSTCVAPVGHWRLDENTGTSANDISGSNLLGTLGGGNATRVPSWTNGKLGVGLNFDGNNDLVDISDNDILSPSGDFTVETWVKLDQLSSTKGESQYLIQKKNNSSSPNWTEWALVQTYPSGNNRFNFTWVNSAGTVYNTDTDGVTLVTNNWYHLAAVKTGTTLKIYVNGVNKSANDQTVAGSAWNSAYYLRLGADEPGGLRLDGSLDDIRMYDYARTPAQVAWDYNRGAPVGWWKMDETSWNNNCATDTVFDSSGNNNHGDACPASTGPVGGATGKFNNCGLFDGSEENVQIADSSSLRFSNNLTISAWIKRADTASAWRTIIHKGQVGGSEFWFGLDTNHKLNFKHAESGSLNASSTAINDTNWHLVQVVYSNPTVTYYIDGVQDANTYSYSDITPSTGLLYIGYGKNWSCCYWYGNLDDVRIYNYALTQQQIDITMNQGAAVRFGP